MARKRRKNRRLTDRAQIAIGTAVIAAAGLTTWVVIRRRRRGHLLPPPPTPQGSNAPSLIAAKRALCSHPDTLSLAQQDLLIDVVFAPLVLLHTASLPAQAGPMQVDQALTMATTEAINATCKQVVPGVVEVAQSLAHAAWLRQTGQSGL